MKLDKNEIESLLQELGQRLSAKGITAELFIVGGAAMALAYNADRSTGDIDGLFRPRDEVLAESHLMAQERGLDRHWLSAGVEDYWPPTEDDAPRSVFSSPGVSINVSSPEYLLGMKVAAGVSRSAGDMADVHRLCEVLGIETVEAAIGIAERVWQGSLPGVAELFVEDSLDYRPPLSLLPAPAGGQGAGGRWPGRRCLAWMPKVRYMCQLSYGHAGGHRKSP